MSCVLSAEEDSETVAEDKSPATLLNPHAFLAPSVGGERHCFICLVEEEKDVPLIRCCTTCYAYTHVQCWRGWRNNQRLTALRSRLLGQRMQNSNMLQCTICKSGTAMLADEEGGLDWMNDVRGSDAGGGNRLAIGGWRRMDLDEDTGNPLDDPFDMRTCFALVVYLGVLVAVLMVACLLMLTQRFYEGDIVLFSIIAIYELSVLQVVVVGITRRRSLAVQAASGRDERSDLEAHQVVHHVPMGTV